MNRILEGGMKVGLKKRIINLLKNIKFLSEQPLYQEFDSRMYETLLHAEDMYKYESHPRRCLASTTLGLQIRLPRCIWRTTLRWQQKCNTLLLWLHIRLVGMLDLQICGRSIDYSIHMPDSRRRRTNRFIFSLMKECNEFG